MQRKNWCLFTFLVFIINSPLTKTEKIVFKYFQWGHTFMSADLFHHQMELSIKQVHELHDFSSRVQATKSGSVEVKHAV